MKQTILVTGASPGFGLMLATSLHGAVHTVIGTSHPEERGNRSIDTPLQ